MTSALTQPLDIELSIGCEFDDCPSTAQFMSLGCGDDRHYSICADHLSQIRERVAAYSSVLVCGDCFTPCFMFDKHYQIQPL